MHPNHSLCVNYRKYKNGKSSFDKTISNIELLKKNKPDEAIKHYHISLMLDPKNDNALVGFAWALHMKGEDNKAIPMLNLSLKLHPK